MYVIRRLAGRGLEAGPQAFKTPAAMPRTRPGTPPLPHRASGHLISPPPDVFVL
jgi:hypothetical protein